MFSNHNSLNKKNLRTSEVFPVGASLRSYRLHSQLSRFSFVFGFYWGEGVPRIKSRARMLGRYVPPGSPAPWKLFIVSFETKFHSGTQAGLELVLSKWFLMA